MRFTFTQFTTIFLLLVTYSHLFLIYLPLDHLQTGHDIAAHAINIRVFRDALAAGQFPVRFVSWTRPGLGFPLFNYYPPGFFYLTTLVSQLTGSLTTSLRLTPLLLLTIGTTAMYLYARRYGRLPGAIATLLYTLTPYLAVDIFVRAALPEITAYALFPVLLLTATSVPTRFLTFSLALSLLFLSHPPSLPILLPILVAFVFIHPYLRQAHRKYLVATLLALGLSAFYLLPALTELGLVYSQRLSISDYNHSSHFVSPLQLLRPYWGYGSSIPGSGDTMPFQIGIVHIAVTFASFIFFTLRQTSPDRRQAFFWLTILTISLYLTTAYSRHFWQLPLLRPVLYPWRFLLVTGTSIPLLAALLVKNVPSRLTLPLAFTIAIPSLAIYHPYFRPYRLLPPAYFNLDSPNWTQSPGIAKFHDLLESSFYPISVTRLPTTPLPPWQLASGTATLISLRQSPHHYQLRSQSTTPSAINFHFPYFPAWRASIDSQPTTLTPLPGYAFPSLTIPPGNHLVEMRLANTPIRTLSNTISTISAAIFVLLLRLSLHPTRHPH